MKGGGQPLSPSLRAFYEPRFGHDFSRVRVHHDARAADSARGVNAQAFTVGHHIVFGAGRYAAETEQGRRLIAHELTHTIQQMGPRLSTPAPVPMVQRQQPATRPVAPPPLPAGTQDDRWTFGEIGSWAITSLRDFTPPPGLANAKASIAAVCSQNPCGSRDGSTSTEPGDRAAWTNIVNAAGGADRTGGGGYMCVGHQQCWFAQQCYACVGGNRRLTNRPAPLAPSGTVAVGTQGTLYFYNVPLDGWCNIQDRNTACRRTGGGRR